MPDNVRHVFIGYCVLVLTICILLIASPIRFFRGPAWLGSFGKPKPLPRLIEKRWIQTAYRVVAIGIFLEVFRLLAQVIRH
jgi:hypothetical protein